MSCVGGQFIISASMHLNEEIHFNKAVASIQKWRCEDAFYLLGESSTKGQSKKQGLRMRLCPIMWMPVCVLNVSHRAICVYIKVTHQPHWLFKQSFQTFTLSTCSLSTTHTSYTHFHPTSARFEHPPVSQSTAPQPNIHLFALLILKGVKKYNFVPCIRIG